MTDSPLPPRKRKLPRDPAYLAEHLARQRENKLSPRMQPKPQGKVGLALKDVLRQMGVLSQMRRRRLHRAWSAAMGHDIRDLRATRIVKLQHGVLTVEVDSATRMHELNVLRRRELIAALNRELANNPLIIDIHFRLGTFLPPPPLPDARQDIP